MCLQEVYDDEEFHELTKEEWDRMTPKQKQQYEFYRRSVFNRKVVRCVSYKWRISFTFLCSKLYRTHTHTHIHNVFRTPGDEKSNRKEIG